MRRMCFKCSWRLYRKSYRRYGLRYVRPWPVATEHNVVHSKILDVCLDVGIADNVEWINQHICPTLFSCQGGDFYGLPGVTVSANDWPTFRDWLSAKGLSIGYATVKDNVLHRAHDVDVPVWDTSRNVHVDFNFNYRELFNG